MKIELTEQDLLRLWSLADERKTKKYKILADKLYVIIMEEVDIDNVERD